MIWCRWCWLLCVLPGLAFGQQTPTWPDRPIRVIVSGAAGGTADAIVRPVMAEVSKRLSQQVVVENRPGASGMIAAEAVARANADGYTYLAAFGSHIVNRILQPKRPYSDNDLTGVSIFGRYAMLLAANKSLPNTPRGLLEYVRANPGALTFASGGDGTLSHLAGEMLAQRYAVKLTHVPYKGGNTAVPDLVAGRVGMMFDAVSTLGPHVRSEKLNAIAISASARTPLLPEVPTFAEAGFPEITAYAWTGLLTQAKTPSPIIDRMSEVIVAALNQAELRALLTGGSFGMELIGGTPAQANRFFDDEEARWGEVIRKGGIRAQ